MPAALVGPAGKAGRERCARVPRSLRFPAGHPSIPPLSDQSAAMVLWHVVFLDRLLDRGLLVRSVIDDADELRRRRPANVVDDPGGVALLFDRSLRHCEGYYTPRGGGRLPADVRPNWSDRPSQESLTGAQRR
jgi:hypothetical protein